MSEWGHADPGGSTATAAFDQTCSLVAASTVAANVESVSYRVQLDHRRGRRRGPDPPVRERRHRQRPLDLGALEEYATLLGTRTLVAKVGFFLEARREELVVPAALLERLRARVPGAPVFMDRSRRGRLVARWALIVPADLLDDGRGDAA